MNVSSFVIRHRRVVGISVARRRVRPTPARATIAMIDAMIATAMMTGATTDVTTGAIVTTDRDHML